MYAEIALVIVLIGILGYKQTIVVDWGNQYLSLYNTNHIKGFFSLVILFHHLTQNISEESSYFGLRNFGYLAVAIFFFFNGFGLMHKIHLDGNYLDSFVKKRVLKIVCPFLFVYVIYIIMDIFEGKSYTIIDIVKSFINGCPIAENLWYVIFIILYYMTFYVLAKQFGKNDVRLLGGVTAFLLVWCLFCFWRKFAPHWFISCFAILLGMIWETYRDKMEIILKKFYVSLLVLFLVLFCICHYGYVLTIATRAAFALAILATLFFTVVVLLLNMKLQNKGKHLQFIGNISFELYMLHGLFIDLFRGNYIYIRNDFLYIVFVIICVILSSYLMNLVVRKIRYEVRKETTS